jgi:hypothetical protein
MNRNDAPQITPGTTSSAQSTIDPFMPIRIGPGTV